MGNKNRLIKSKRVIIPTLAFLAATAGGFKASEPELPQPTAGEAPVGSWSGRPMVPGTINSFVSGRLPDGHKSDLTASVKLYRGDATGNYAVMTYNLLGDNKIDTTVTCRPDKTLDVAYDPGIHFVGRAALVKHFDVDGDLSARTCATGKLTAQGITSFVNAPSGTPLILPTTALQR